MRRDSAALAGLFVVSGVIHLVRPEVYERIVPKVLPKKREIVYASGVAEIACAALMTYPPTRRLGGQAAAALLVGVFPANVQMAVDVSRSRRAPLWFKLGTIARLPLQWPMIKAARATARA